MPSKQSAPAAQRASLSQHASSSEAQPARPVTTTSASTTVRALIANGDRAERRFAQFDIALEADRLRVVLLDDLLAILHQLREEAIVGELVRVLTALIARLHELLVDVLE